MRKLWVVLALAVGCLIGYSVRAYRDWEREDRRIRQDFVRRIEGASVASFLSGVDYAELKTWRRVLGPMLREWLEKPWCANDYRWGAAFRVLKGPFLDGCKFRPDMEERTQDEMVRYLCYRIAAICDSRTHTSGVDAAFRDLATYPEEIMARHQEKVEWALDRALNSAFGDYVYNAHKFLAARIGEPWVEKVAWEYLNAASLWHSCGIGLTHFPSRILLRDLHLEFQRGNRAAAAMLLRFADHGKEIAERDGDEVSKAFILIQTAEINARRVEYERLARSGLHHEPAEAD